MLPIPKVIIELDGTVPHSASNRWHPLKPDRLDSDEKNIY